MYSLQPGKDDVHQVAFEFMKKSWERDVGVRMRSKARSNEPSGWMSFLEKYSKSRCLAVSFLLFSLKSLILGFWKSYEYCICLVLQPTTSMLHQGRCLALMVYNNSKSSFSSHYNHSFEINYVYIFFQSFMQWGAKILVHMEQD